MKNNIYKISGLALVAALFLCALTARAQEMTTGGDATVEASTEVKTPVTRPTIKAQIQSNIEKNKEARNTELQKMQDARKGFMMERKDVRASTTEMMKVNMEARKDMHASTTAAMMMFKRDMTTMKDARKDVMKKMRFDMFEVRRNALVRELKMSLEIMQNIYTRLDSRITKAESEGRSMTEARAALKIANDKLVQAKADVTTLDSIALFPADDSVSMHATTTAEVDLAGPRKVGDKAIQSVKEARDALKKVIDIIAHAMGFGATASTTTSVN